MVKDSAPDRRLYLWEENEREEADQRPVPEPPPLDLIEIKRLSRLLRDLLQAGAEAADVILCEDCMNQLDLFVSDELNGLDVRQQHPNLWAHLQMCESCRQEYEQLRDLLTRERQGDLESPPPFELPRLPFLAPQPVTLPWYSVVDRSGEGAHLSLQFPFAPAYLQHSLMADWPTSARRGLAEATPEPILLLADVVEIQGHEVAVQAHAQRSENEPATFCLDVNMVTTLDFAETPTVVLTWGNREYRAALDASGRARFAELPLQMLATATGEEPVAAFSLRMEVRPVHKAASSGTEGAGRQSPRTV